MDRKGTGMVMWFSDDKNRFKKLILFKKHHLVIKLYIYKKIAKNIAECMQMYIRTDNFFRIWIAVSILKISNVCNINSKLAIELHRFIE